MSLRIRRGTDAQRQQFTPDEGELIYTTNTYKLFIGDGATQGGKNIGQALAGSGLVFDTITQTLQATAPQSSGITAVSQDLNPALGGNLNLNNFNITGTGTIGIVGTVYASQGLGGDLALNTHSITGTGNINVNGNLSVAGLGADLSLNGHNITGTGSINTSGTLSVSGLGADLSLNGHSITGTGTINIGSSVTATTFTATTGLGANLPLNTFGITGTGTININGAITGTTLTAPGVATDSISTRAGNSSGLELYTPYQNGFDLCAYRGTISAQTTLLAGDNIGQYTMKPYNGTNYNSVSMGINATLDATATVSDQFPKSTVRLFVGAGGSSLATASFNYAGVFSAPVLQTTTYTTSTLPTASSVGVGARAFVTDATAITWGTAYAGNGSNKVPVWSNGTAWYIG